MRILDHLRNVAKGRQKTGALRSRKIQVEPLEMRTLLSVSPTGGVDELGTDPAEAVLAGDLVAGASADWIDSLTPEQAQVRDDLLSLLDRDGKIDELENFEPVLMPEAFLDELYEAYGSTKVWGFGRLI